MSNKFRKKPIVIEAVQFTGANFDDFTDWAGGGNYPDGWVYDYDLEQMVIPTLEGNHQANLGDWIIKGVKGELYPCKPDIFDLTYEPVEPET